MSHAADRYDAIVVGVGGIGSAVVYELARRGERVLGLERYSIPHTNGSSHGYSRIIRRAYHEDPGYVSMVSRAYDRWRALEDRADEQLLYETGSIAAGPPDSDLVTGAVEACRAHGIDHERLDAAETTARFPGLDVPDDHESVYQADGGFVRPEAGIVAHVRLAQRAGARIQARERVIDWQSTTDGVRVSTDKGQYAADRLVVAAGAWTGELVEPLADELSPERQVIAWMQPERPRAFTPERLPVFLVSDEEGVVHYGIPTFGAPGVKFGRHYHLHEVVDPTEMDDEPTARDESVLRAAADEYLTVGDATLMGLETCLYTNTEDRDFIVDTLPNHPDVVVLAGFSGHGYKFAGTLGEIGADLATGEPAAFDLDPFRIGRL
jgi:sarcosine oxidase